MSGINKLLRDMDAGLSHMGLYRKTIHSDNTCLFRAVSEKLFYTQCYHLRVRDNCLGYLSRHVSEYQPFVDECLEERIRNIQDGQIKAGHLEMIIMARMYRLDFVLLHGPSLQPVSLTHNCYNNQIILSSVEDNHFDLIYTKESIEAAGICQSIIYEVVYRGVFGLESELEEAVLFLELQKHFPKEHCLLSCSLHHVISLLGPDKVDIVQKVCALSCPPLPYRIAKALHPALYRNVELDIVQEEKREARLRTLDACKGFSPGDKCQVVLDESQDHPYTGHIQVIDEQKGTVLVFIEQLGVKETVPVRAIRPLPLKVPATGDVEQSLPVAELDLLPYFKRGRRRKQQQIVTVPSSDDKNSSLISPYRGCSNSSSSSGYCNTVGCRSEGSNTNIISTVSTDSCLIAQSSHQVISNIWNIGGGSGSVFPGETYSSHCSEVVLPAAFYVNTLTDSSSKSTFDQSLASCHIYPSQQVQTDQLVSAADSNQAHYAMSIGSAPTQGPGYWVPVVAVPYASNMGHVNVGWNPSQDPQLSGVDTLHYFFNLGVEYYRMPSSCGQPVSYPPGLMYSPHTSPEMNQPLAVMVETSGGHYTNMTPLVCSSETHISCSDGGSITTRQAAGNGCVKLMSKTAAINFSFNLSEKYAKTIGDGCLVVQGQTLTVDSACNSVDSGTVTKPTDDSGQDNSITGRHVHEHVKNVGVAGKSITNDNGKTRADDDDDVSEGMDERSDGDSGCPSECADLSSIVGPGCTEISQCEGADFPEQADSVNNPKARGKRRYYMYGNHKLVKPIKEIPLRFQILLAETSAAKARCEGQPIYMQQQQQPVYDCVYYPAKDGPQLNANATCFVPSHDSCVDANMSPTYIPDCYTLPCYPNTLPLGQSSHVNCLQPATMFVPPVAPPPSLPANSSTTQSCQAIIVYSSNSTSCTHSSPQASQQIHSVSMPPPQYPPPLTLPPPTVDQTSAHSTPCLSPAVNHVPRTVTAHYSQSAVPYNDHFLKAPSAQSPAAIANKPSVILSVPPPNHTSTVQGPNVQHNTSAAPNSVVPSNTCRFSSNSHTYLPMPQPAFPPPSNMHAAGGISPPSPPHSSPNSACIVGNTHPVPYHGGVSANQYMYVYQSAPTGPPATPPHVVYMVGPAYPPTQTYQQPAVVFPPSCPVPVQ